MNASQQTDVRVENHGTIFLFFPETDTAREWINENVDPDAQWFGNGLAIEHRFAWAMSEGMQAEGLVLE